MHIVGKWFFGRLDFGESEEYQAFQFKLLCIVLFIGAVVTALLQLGSHAGISHIGALLHWGDWAIFPDQ